MKLQRSSDKLRASILSSIRTKECHRARIYLGMSGVTLLSSVTGFIIAIKYLFEVFYASEFYSYATLLFSDTDVAFAFWREIVLSLLESIPVPAVVAALATALLVLVSIRGIARNIKLATIPSFGI